MAALLFVTYPGDATSRFDRDYYVATHLPLVEQGWGPFGLISARAFFPANDGPHVAVAVLSFADEDAIGAALGSAATEGILADLPNLTDIAPEIARGVAS